MRRLFADLLYNEIKINKNIYLLTGDLGFGMWDNIKNDFSENFINVGSSEQLLIGAATGLALKNKIPICYSITSFLIYRPFEFIRNYLNKESIPVKLLGGGIDRDYEKLGFSHWSEEIREVMKLFPNIIQFYPKKEELNKDYLEDYLYNNKPSFLGLRR